MSLRFGFPVAVESEKIIILGIHFKSNLGFVILSQVRQELAQFKNLFGELEFPGLISSVGAPASTSP